MMHPSSRQTKQNYHHNHDNDNDEFLDEYVENGNNNNNNNNTRNNKMNGSSSSSSSKNNVYDMDDDDDDASMDDLHRRLHKSNNRTTYDNHDNDNDGGGSSTVTDVRNNKSYNQLLRNNNYNNNNNGSSNNHNSQQRYNTSGLSDDELNGIEDTHEDGIYHHNNNNNQHHPSRRNNNHICSCCCRYLQKIMNCFLKCSLPRSEYRGICACPHGRCYGIMGVLTAQGGLMMNLYVLGTCTFYRIKLINPVTGETIPGSERGYGFRARETNYGQIPDYRQCTYYPSNEFDEINDHYMILSKIFSYTSAVLGTIGFLILFSICSCAYSKSMFEKWLFWLYIIAAITVALTFFMFGNEFCQLNECSVADGCGWTISCFFFHLMAANTVKNFPGPNKNKDKQNKNKNKNKNNNNPDNDDNDDDDGLPTIDDVYDELYYDNEYDKYPPPLPDGMKRGVIYNDQGQPEFDNGEDYFDDMGNYMDPETNGSYRRTNIHDPNHHDDYKNRNNSYNDNNNNDNNDDDDDEDDDDDDSYSTNYDTSEYDSDNDEELDEWEKQQEAKRMKRAEKLLLLQKEQQEQQQQYKEEEPLDSKKNEMNQPIRPEDRVFPMNDNDNSGNLGVGYEHLDHHDDEPKEQHPVNINNKNNKVRHGKLYGAPARPVFQTQEQMDGVVDYDDYSDHHRPVLT